MRQDNYLIPGPVVILGNICEFQPTPKLRWYHSELQQWWEAKSGPDQYGTTETHGRWVTVQTET